MKVAGLPGELDVVGEAWLYRVIYELRAEYLIFCGIKGAGLRSVNISSLAGDRKHISGCFLEA